MLLADFGFNPASQVYTVLTESLQDDRRDQIVRLLRAEIRGWQDYRTDYAEAAELAIELYPDAGQENGFAWFTDEVVENNMVLFEDLGITGATPELFDRSLLEEIFADGPTI
jgi:NitT/TauT family transport system substrate-binding protein